jgi:ATP-binding cassette, subfamily B, bacterial
MIKPQPTTPAATGRPSAGHLLKQAFQTAAGKRMDGKDLTPLLRLWPSMRAHLGDALLGTLFVVLSSATTLGLTIASRRLVDRGFRVHTADALLSSFLIAAGTAALFALATALRIYFVNKLGEGMVVDLRKSVYRHVLELDLCQVLKVRTGELLSRMTTDMTIVERMVTNAGPVAMRCTLTLVGAVCLLLAVSPSFTGWVVVLLPLGLAPLFVFADRLRRLSTQAQDRFAEAIAQAGEGLEGLETVLAFGQEHSISGQFGQTLEHAFAASRRFIRARVTMTGLMILLIASGILAILFRCALAVFVDHTMTAGVLLQLLMLSMLAASSARELGEVWGEINKASGALERITELMDLRPTIAAPVHPRPLPAPARGEIDFRDVAFAYPDREDDMALDGFTLNVRPGERVALVGPSGAGKSTVFRLLLRFYDPVSGSISIDGVDLREADPREVRARMALVAQDAALFSGPASDNIRFGRARASAEDVRAAASAAQASDFLSALPQGFETPIGERARTLSGGQRQRLVIARALVRNAPILLLDEATSALDAENERLVHQAMHEAMEGRTTLVIAHRLATVLEADRIVVMQGGRVIEQGKHAELSARDGLYARLARLQFAANAA